MKNITENFTEKTSATFLKAFIFCFLVAWIIFYWDIFGNPYFYLPWDNFGCHYPMFSYITNYIKYFHSFPVWFYTREGGIWIEALANNYLILLPYRMVGYLVASMTALPINMVYKVSFLILGQGFFLFGLYYFAKSVLYSQRYALMLVFISLITSVSIALLHQEQMLGTIFYIPFIWIFIIKLRKDAKSLIPLSALLGLSLNNHYPQLLLVYFFAILVSAIFCFNQTHRYFQDVFIRLKGKSSYLLIGLSIISFFVSASPVIYSYSRFKDKIASPYRLQYESIEAESYDDYTKMNLFQDSNLYPKNFRFYFGLENSKTERMIPLDENTLFMTPAILLAFSLIFILKFSYKYFQLLLIFLLSLLSIGIYGPMPRILWQIIPGIKLFRQWYHFLPLLNLHILFLIFVVMKSFVKTRIFNNRERLLIGTLAIIFLFLTWKGYLNPLYGLIPAVVLVIRLLPDKLEALRKVVVTLTIFLWIIFGSLKWALSTMDEYKTNLIISKASQTESEDRLNFLVYPIDDPKGYDMSNLTVVPKGIVDVTSVRNLFRFGGIYLLTKDNYFVNLDKKDFLVQTIVNGFKIKVLKSYSDTTSLALLQYNDGGWIAKDDYNRVIPTKLGPFNMLKIPLDGTFGSLSVTRRFSLWNFLIFIMWIPIIGAGLTKIYAIRYFW